MKITVTEIKSREIELPPYFEHIDSFYMLIGDKSMVRVYPKFQEKIDLYPIIEITAIKYFSPNHKYPIKPISEAQFRNEFLKVSLELEKLMN